MAEVLFPRIEGKSGMPKRKSAVSLLHSTVTVDGPRDSHVYKEVDQRKSPNQEASTGITNTKSFSDKVTIKSKFSQDAPSCKPPLYLKKTGSKNDSSTT